MNKKKQNTEMNMIEERKSFSQTLNKRIQRPNVASLTAATGANAFSCFVKYT